jgi:hypothetical protein
MSIQRRKKEIKIVGIAGLHLKLSIKIHPIRICIYGGTLEFLYFIVISQVKK